MLISWVIWQFVQTWLVLGTSELYYCSDAVLVALLVVVMCTVGGSYRQVRCYLCAIALGTFKR